MLWWLQLTLLALVLLMSSADAAELNTSENAVSQSAPLVGEVTTTASEKDLNTGHHHIKHGHYRKAYRHFKKLAHKGCAYSQCIVGIMHQKGVGAKKDMKEAVFWMEKSASQGWKDAQHRLGMIHLTGEGIEKNIEQGVKWLEMAAQAGVLEAKMTLDEIGREGNDALREGRKWMTGEASKGIAQAKAAAAGVPTFAGPDANAPPKTEYERGLMNVQKSWTGYVDVVKNLESMSNRTGK